MNVSTVLNAPSAINMQRLPPFSLRRPGQSPKNVELARRWLSLGSIIADLAPKDGAPSRLALLNISFGFLAQAATPWAARFWEQDAPPGVQPVEWILGSRYSVSSIEDALQLLHETQGLVTTYAVT